MTKSDPNALNNILIDTLIADNHIVSQSVEAAFRAVLRHNFVPDQPVEDVYQDRAIATKSIDNIAVSSSSQPTMMAIMLEQLELRPGQRVLEVGAGTGFNAALMAHIVGKSGHVTTIDIDADIIDDANAHLATAGYDHVEVICGDGGHGWQPNAPYDRIILTVGAGDITPAWWEQLAPNGILVLPLELGSGQLSVAFEKQQRELVSRSIRHCGFIRLRGTFASEREPQSMGPSPDVHIMLGSAVDPHIDTDKIYEMLKHRGRTCYTDVMVTPQEAWEGLGSWLLLREPEASLMVAVAEAAEQDIFPALNTFRQSRYISTVGLCSPNGLAVVYIPSKAPPADKRMNRFKVMVRQFGENPELSRRMVQLVQEWQRGGRPLCSEIEIKAYQKETVVRESISHGDHALLISKTWTNYHLLMPNRS